MAASESEILIVRCGRGSVYSSVTIQSLRFPSDYFSLLQLGFGIKTNPLVDRRRVRLHIHWRHLQKEHLFFSFIESPATPRQ